jgi:hypothetical protein
MPAIVLLIVWICFIFLVSCAEEVNSIAFLYVSSVTLCLTYLINTFKNIYMSLQVSLVLLTIPSFIFWYLFITYNYFLRINPISYETVVFIMFAYFYILIYLFFPKEWL